MNFFFLLVPIGTAALETIPEESGDVFFRLLAILFLIVLNGFFVASEFAIVKVRPSQMESIADDGDARAGLSKHILSNLDSYLSTVQLGISVTSLALGWLGGTFLVGVIEPLFAFLGMAHPALAPIAAFVVAFSGLAYLHIVIGELVPKSLAIRKSVPVTLSVSRPLSWFYEILRPLVWVVSTSANWILRHVLKIEPAKEGEDSHSEEELRVILSESEEDGQVSSMGREILINALDLKHLVVCDIMTPRGEVVYLDLNEPFEEQITLAIDSQHTRFPLCRGHLDEAIGLVHIKDLMALFRKGNKDLAAVRRELFHVSEIMPLEKLLRFFLSKQAHLALVVDEYGGAVGVVTLDNVLEELVGSIQDEFDEEEVEVRRISEDELDVDGGLALYELNDLLGLELDNSEVSTLGGYITSELGHIPQKGESAEIGEYLATVLEGDGRRVLRVHLRRQPPPPKEEPAAPT